MAEATTYIRMVCVCLLRIRCLGSIFCVGLVVNVLVSVAYISEFGQVVAEHYVRKDEGTSHGYGEDQFAYDYPCREKVDDLMIVDILYYIDWLGSLERHNAEPKGRSADNLKKADWKIIGFICKWFHDCVSQCFYGEFCKGTV